MIDRIRELEETLTRRESMLDRLNAANERQRAMLDEQEIKIAGLQAQIETYRKLVILYRKEEPMT